MGKVDIRQDGALFSIGQTAKLFDLNIRTLRYYDQIGLLKPEVVNDETGYRYYSSAQFERLNTIRYLRALDVPIERIAAFFDDRDVGLMRGIFEDQLARVREKQRELARIEQKIESRIERIDEAVSSPLDEIEVVELPERRIVSLAESFAPSADLEPLIRDLSHRSQLDDAIFLGKVGVSISRNDLASRSFDKLSSVFILVEAADAHEGDESLIPAGRFVQMRFRGTHREAASRYSDLIAYIDDAGGRIIGDSVETTIIDAGMTSDESQFVTELQIPFEAIVQKS